MSLTVSGPEISSRRGIISAEEHIFALRRKAFRVLPTRTFRAPECFIWLATGVELPLAPQSIAVDLRHVRYASFPSRLGRNLRPRGLASAFGVEPGPRDLGKRLPGSAPL